MSKIYLDYSLSAREHLCGIAKVAPGVGCDKAVVRHH
jgi:hypothetical protein